MTTILLFVLILGLAPILLAGLREVCLLAFQWLEMPLLILGTLACFVGAILMVWVLWNNRQIP